MHTKKTNNTNKVMQISYHSALIKIQKLQNFKKKKKKKKKLFSVPADIAQNWPVRPIFFPVRNREVICTSLFAGTVRNRLPWVKWQWRPKTMTKTSKVQTIPYHQFPIISAASRLHYLLDGESTIKHHVFIQFWVNFNFFLKKNLQKR